MTYINLIIKIIPACPFKYTKPINFLGPWGCLIFLDHGDAVFPFPGYLATLWIWYPAYIKHGELKRFLMSHLFPRYLGYRYYNPRDYVIWRTDFFVLLYVEVYVSHGFRRLPPRISTQWLHLVAWFIFQLRPSHRTWMKGDFSNWDAR